MKVQRDCKKNTRRYGGAKKAQGTTTMGKNTVIRGKERAGMVEQENTIYGIEVITTCYEQKSL